MKTLRELVDQVKADGQRCFCDLDNWEPEPDTGHSWVCPIDKRARALLKKQRERRPV